MRETRPPIFTIGHSTRALDEFLFLLHESSIAALADVRAIPMSRRYPHFNAPALAAGLAAMGIAYVPMPELGGRRGKARDVPPETNALWENQSFHNYADYAMSRAFADALAELRALAHRGRTAVMCSEAVWWRCHRRIIADYLIAEGEDVRHILGPGKVEMALLTPGAITVEAAVRYPKPGDAAQPRLF